MKQTSKVSAPLRYASGVLRKTFEVFDSARRDHRLGISSLTGAGLNCADCEVTVALAPVFENVTARDSYEMPYPPSGL